MEAFRSGDAVLHKPSGETWLVAWADENEVICCGWPETLAKASDCEIVRRADDKYHLEIVRQVAENKHSTRGSRCGALLDKLRHETLDELTRDAFEAGLYDSVIPEGRDE